MAPRPRRRSLTSLAVLSIVLTMGAMPVHALTAGFTSPYEGEVFIGSGIPVSGTAATTLSERAVEGRSGFAGGSFSGVEFREGEGLRLTTMFRDDFNGSALSDDVWELSPGGGIDVSVGGGSLHMAGVENAQVWGGPTLETKTRYNGSFSLFASVAAGGSGTGYGLMFAISISENVYFRCGPLCDNSRSRNSLLYINYKTGSPGEGIQSDDDGRDLDSRFHTYGLIYNSSSGTVQVYLDGALKATKPWITGASEYSVFIAGWGRFDGDRLDGRVDMITCGYTSGSYVSPPLPVAPGGQYLRRMGANATMPAGARLSVQARTTDSAGAPTGWTDMDPARETALLLGGSVQFRLELSTDDPLFSPSVSAVRLAWSPEVLAAESSLDGLAWTPLEGTTNWAGNVTLAMGQNNIRVRVNDTSGESLVVNRSVWLLPEPEVPSGRLLINSNDAYTTSARVALQFTVYPGPAVVSVKVSNSNDLSGLPWLPYADTMAWDIPGGDGPRTVFCVFLSVDGTPSTTMSDEIILDTTPPQIAILGPANGSKFREDRIEVLGTARDQSGVVSVELRVNGGAWAPCNGLSSWNATVALPSNARYLIEARATDVVGRVNQTSVLVSRVPAPARSLISGECLTVALLAVIVAGALTYLYWRAGRNGSGGPGAGPE